MSILGHLYSVTVQQVMYVQEHVNDRGHLVHKTNVRFTSYSLISEAVDSFFNELVNSCDPMLFKLFYI
jgi:hypothetical protein